MDHQTLTGQRSNEPSTEHRKLKQPSDVAIALQISEPTGMKGTQYDYLIKAVTHGSFARDLGIHLFCLCSFAKLCIKACQLVLRRIHFSDLPVKLLLQLI